MTKCPCQSGLPFSQCCQPLLQKQQFASTAEQLMRSRYSAFAVKNKAYLLHTWHPEYRPNKLEFQADMEWVNLSIVEQKNGQPEQLNGMVHFRAFFKLNGKLEVLEERSLFSKLNGQWCYEQGEQIAFKINISRNAPCPCGSTKKYKRCCA